MLIIVILGVEQKLTRITKQLLERTINNINKEYLKEYDMHIHYDAYEPTKGTVYYKLYIEENINSGIKRETNSISIKEAYHYLVGIMHFQHMKEMILKRRNDKQ